MKDGRVSSLPYIIGSAYIAILSSTRFPLSYVRMGSLILFVCLGMLAYRQWKKKSLSPVEQGYLLYAAVNVGGFWLLPGTVGSVLKGAPAAFLYGSLLAMAVVPALFGGPWFTEYFARRSTPSAVWETDIFKNINRNMSLMWAGLFAASFAVALVPYAILPHGGLVTALAFQIVLPAFLLLGLGVPLNKKYPGFYQRRMGIEPVAADGSSTEILPAEQTTSKSEKEEVMLNRLKVVAINGSPHAGGGNTSIMTQMMAPALAAEGIDLEEIFLADYRIEYCVGCGVCMEKGKCWRQDDHGKIIEKVLGADGLILSSPVYFGLVTAQMKAFLDRSLAYGHKPRTTWKPGLAISVSAGKAEVTTAEYLVNVLHVYGAFPVNRFTAIAVGPGAFLGKDLVEQRALDMARDLARAIKEKRRYPATENDLSFYLFMGDLVRREKDFMRDDYKHWEDSGFYQGFESYVGQHFTNPPYNEEMRKEWLKDMISSEVAKAKGSTAAKAAPEGQADLSGVTSCRELLKAMPLGFKKEAANGLKAVYQFEITGPEEVTAHLVIANGACTYVEGPNAKPDVVVKSPADVWLAVSKGELNGQAAFMSGKYKVEGDLSLLMKLSKIFGQ
jgi:multimeric flavodoxin WrbA/putative sterol carrier protein